MYNVSTFGAASQFEIVSIINSGPLSQRMCSGNPRIVAL